jgi:hypothetical protein
LSGLQACAREPDRLEQEVIGLERHPKGLEQLLGLVEFPAFDQDVDEDRDCVLSGYFGGRSGVCFGRREIPSPVGNLGLYR